MTTAPLHAYVVVLNFGEGGPLHADIWLAPDEASAVALATVQLMQHVEIKAPLLSCIAAEIPVERLRHLLRAVEGKLPESGNAEVLSLVPKTETQDDPETGSTGGQLGVFYTNLNYDPVAPPRNKDALDLVEGRCPHNILPETCRICGTLPPPY